MENQDTPSGNVKASTFWSKNGTLRMPWKLASFFGVWLVSAMLIGTMYYVAMRGSAWEIGQGAMSLGAALAATVFALKAMERKPFSSVGLQVQGNWLALFFLGVGVSALMMGIIFTAQLTGGILEVRFIQVTVGQGLATFLNGLALFVMVGFGEEILFRGYPMQLLARAWGLPVSILACSVVFALFHFFNPNTTFFSLANIFLAGVWLGTAYAVSGSLWLPAGMHLGWNFFQGTIVGLPVSGTVTRGLLLSIERGDDWITGGSFGPEGGALASVVLCACTAAMLHPRWKRFWKHQLPDAAYDTGTAMEP